jgi:hypothetical protein
MQVLIPKAGEVARIQEAQRMEHIQRQFDNKEAIAQHNDKTFKQVSKSVRGETSYVEERKDKEKQQQKKQKKSLEHNTVQKKEDHDSSIRKKTVLPGGDANIIDITI